MGVVRREGDWRLEKRAGGWYEITYRQEVELAVLTPEYSETLFDGPAIGVPLREVGSYDEAVGLFEEKAHGGSPSGIGFTPTTASGRNSKGSSAGGGGGQLGSTADDMDLPPGAIAAVFLFVGGFVLKDTGFAPNSTMFLFGAGFSAVGVVIFAWAGYLIREQGFAAGLNFLLSMTDDTTSGSNDSSGSKTPPLSEKKKNQLIFDRAERRCEWCGDRTDHPEVHHIKRRAEGGPNTPSNLIVLCPNHHRMADSGSIGKSKLKATVRRQPAIQFD